MQIDAQALLRLNEYKIASDKSLAALTYRAAGMNVIPIRAPDPSLAGTSVELKVAKLPTLVDYIIFAMSTGPPERLLQRLERQSGENLAILTGAGSGVVVLDVDFNHGGRASYESLSLPPTLTVKTPFGLHLYFRHPGGFLPSSFQILAPGIDVKGEGGWVVCPPSRNAFDMPYQWQTETMHIASFPAHVLDMIGRSHGWYERYYYRIREMKSLLRLATTIPLHRRGII